MCRELRGYGSTGSSVAAGASGCASSGSCAGLCAAPAHGGSAALWSLLQALPRRPSDVAVPKRTQVHIQASTTASCTADNNPAMFCRLWVVQTTLLCVV